MLTNNGALANVSKYLTLDDGMVLVESLGYSESSGPPSSMVNSGEESDGADSITTSTASKRSNSKPENKRGPARRDKKARRAQLHNKKIGKEERNDPGYRHSQASTALAHAGSFACQGAAASRMYTVGVAQKDAEYLEQGRDGGSAVLVEKVKDSLAKEIPISHQKYVAVIDGEPYCRVCQKVATESHLRSPAHCAKMEEEAISNTLGGNASSVRRFDPDLCRGCPTRKLIFGYWGDGIQCLPQEAQKIHELKGEFYVNSKIDRPVLAKDCRHELGIVSYSGTGKYQDSTYIPWHDVPDDEICAEDYQKIRRSPDNQGWWPVIALQTIRTGPSSWQVLLVCFYQLQSDGPVAAWWINYDECSVIPEEPLPLQDGDATAPLQGVWAEPANDNPWHDL